jgi:ferredoxin, 2Fe-2S
MPRVTFIEANGARHDVEAIAGSSLLQVAQEHEIEGMVGECGACLSCATCHVYIEEPWLGKLSPPEADEDVMLDGTLCDRLPTSRLGCQIIVTDALDGLSVQLPERQN